MGNFSYLEAGELMLRRLNWQKTVLLQAFLLLGPSLWLDVCFGQEHPNPFRRITTLAGSGATGSPKDQGPALEMALSNPFGVQVEPDGSLIIASYDQHVIYRLDPSYRMLRVIAGTGQPGMSGRDGDFPLKAAMNQPHEVQLGSDGSIFIADTMNHRVVAIDGPTGRWRTIAGTGQQGFSGDSGRAQEAQLNQAYSIAISDNVLFIADLGNQRIRRVDLTNGAISTICGTGQAALPKDGELAISQPLLGPRSLAVDADNLWIVLREGNSVWRIDRSNHRIYHVAGTQEKGYSGDGGPAKLAEFRGPKGLAVDPDHAVYVADTENHAIRRIDLHRGTISTVVGSLTAGRGYNGGGDQLDQRQLNRPHGVCLLPTGELLIGDSENHRLRMLSP